MLNVPVLQWKDEGSQGGGRGGREGENEEHRNTDRSKHPS